MYPDPLVTRALCLYALSKLEQFCDYLFLCFKTTRKNTNGTANHFEDTVVFKYCLFLFTLSQTTIDVIVFLQI